jgi:formylglycine-generating enzyme
VHPQLKIRISYDTEQPAAGSTWTEPTTNMTFVYVPPGCFQIGSPKTEIGHQPNESQTRFCLQGFWMGKTEVTNAQYQYQQNHDSGEGFNQDNQPVVKISRLQAHHFAQWLSEKTGETFRLPTEAQWEYAARAGKTSAYTWENDSNAACQHGNIADITWRTHHKAATSETCTDHYAVTAPVAQFQPNNFGLYDMNGNVSEWTCSTMPFDSRYTTANTCDLNGLLSMPLIRGSHFGHSGNQIRLAKRFWSFQNPQQIGFRLIRVPTSQP